MPKVSDLSQSRFLKKEDVGKGMLVTVKGWTEENVEPEGKPKKFKFVLHWEEEVKPLVLNSVNGQLIEQITGSDDFDNWAGHKLVLYTDPNVMMEGKLVGGIRVRAPRNVAPTTSAPKPTPRPAPRPTPAPAREPEAEPCAESDDVPF